MNASDEKILDDRLQNWGRRIRDPRRQGRSSLCAVIESNPENVSRGEPTAPIDVNDALLVQRAWERLLLAPERFRKARMVVGVVYAYPVPYLDLKRILRKYHRINIHEREFDGLVVLGQKMIRNNLRKIDGKGKK